MFIPGDYFGGCEDYAFRIADSAIKQDWTVSLVFSSCVVYQKAKDCLPASNLYLVPCPFGPEFNGPRSLAAFFRLAFLKVSYKKILKRHRPSIVHAVLPWHYHSIFFLDTCISIGLPVLVTYQLVAPNRPPHKKQFQIFSRIHKSGKLKVCAISNNNRLLLASYYNISESEIAMIPNRPRPYTGFIAQHEQRHVVRQRLALEHGLPHDAVVSITVASLCDQKGIDILLKGSRLLIENLQNIFFLVAGDGPNRYQLESLAEALNVQHRVLFLGHREDINSLLSASDLFLFPTRYEGESFALLEAARSFLPIVASKASGIPETFSDGVDALLFDIDDAEGMCGQVIRLLTEKSLAESLAQNAFKRVSMFNEADMISATLSLLQSTARVR